MRPGPKSGHLRRFSKRKMIVTAVPVDARSLVGILQAALEFTEFEMLPSHPELPMTREAPTHSIHWGTERTTSTKGMASQWLSWKCTQHYIAQQYELNPHQGLRRGNQGAHRIHFLSAPLQSC